MSFPFKIIKSVGILLTIAMQHFYIIVKLVNFYIIIYIIYLQNSIMS